MKYLLLLLLALSLAGTASAQTASQSDVLERGVMVGNKSLEIVIPQVPASAAAPMAEDVKLSYYNPDAPAFGWQAPLQVNAQLVVLRYSQRFTLPTETGFLDSIRVRFSAATGDTIYILIQKDSLFEFQGGNFHLMDVQSDNNVYAGALIPIAILPQIAVEGWVTIQFPHVPVPKEFHIVVAPRIITDGTNIQSTSSFTLVAENTIGTIPSTETSRSNFLALTAQGQSVSIMDNFFSVDNEQVAVNFHMEAYVNAEAGSVARPATSAAAMFPNPISSNGTLNIQHNEQINSVRIVNMLGNEMQSWTGNSSSVKLSTSDLAKGVYNVIVNTENGVTTEKLIVN